MHEITKIKKKRLKKQEQSTSLLNMKQATAESSNNINKSMMKSTIIKENERVQEIKLLEQER